MMTIRNSRWKMGKVTLIDYEPIVGRLQHMVEGLNYFLAPHVSIAISTDRDRPWNPLTKKSDDSAVDSVTNSN